jgi:hypothetical protein
VVRRKLHQSRCICYGATIGGPGREQPSCSRHLPTMAFARLAARRGCAVDLSQKRLASGHVSAGLDVVKPATVGRNLGFLIGAASDSMTLVQWDGQDSIVLSSRSSIETSRSLWIDNKWDLLVKIGLIQISMQHRIFSLLRG